MEQRWNTKDFCGRISMYGEGQHSHKSLSDIMERWREQLFLMLPALSARLNLLSRTIRSSMSEERTNCLKPSGSVFSYFRYPEWDKPFFEVEADGILEADDKLKAETGIVAAKNPNVGCKIFPHNVERRHRTND